jgi:hypothetical protein
MAHEGRYHTMFELQASRFDEPGTGDEEGVTYDVLA